MPEFTANEEKFAKVNIRARGGGGGRMRRIRSRMKERRRGGGEEEKVVVAEKSKDSCYKIKKVIENLGKVLHINNTISNK